MKTKIQLFIKKYPIYTCLILFLLNMFFRINDIFILRLDEVWGEIALSKTMGIFIIIGFLFTQSYSCQDKIRYK
jgi:hypothetical protein